MGCCISKCKLKKQQQKQHSDHINDDVVVHDKVVISQPPPTTPKLPIMPPSCKMSPCPPSNKISPCPPSPTTSTSSSVSSFTCTNSSSTITSCSSLSTGSPSISSSKDRSFSNEFLWSCIKENPHIIRINSIKECSQLLVHQNVVHTKKLDSSAKNVVTQPKQSIPQTVNASLRQKRVRSNSPTMMAPLNRQKSFRRESERSDSSYNLSSRTLRSPSPSRRFNGESGRPISGIAQNGSRSKRMVYGVKENMRPAMISPYFRQNHLLGPNCSMRNKETCIHRISSKIDEMAVDEALAAAQQDSECVPMEDADNPHISLDCFIFL